jgi:uncharacterized protein YndB with AHSA1/START domain
MSEQGGAADFVISRVFDAPRERVWQALTEPERLKDWWPPKTFTMIHASMDLRPGGIFHSGMRSVEGYKLWAKFIYREVAPLERLVFVNSFSNQAGEVKRNPVVPTWPLLTLIVIALEDEAGGKTKLTVTWSPHEATEIERQTFNASHVGLKATWSAAFDQLAAYLAKAG